MFVSLNPPSIKAGLGQPTETANPPPQAANSPTEDKSPSPSAENWSMDTSYFTTIVHFTDGVRQREAFFLKILKTSMDDETLSQLRITIAGLTGSIEISNFPFCNKNGAIVPETLTVEEYLMECLEIDIDNAKTLSIYMRSEALTKDRDNSVKAEASSGLDADTLVHLKQHVNDTAFKWITGTEAKYVPELEQRDWAVIFDSNALGYGLRIVRAPSSTATSATDTKGVAIGLERARFQAFRLKKRGIWSDSLPNSTIEGVKLELRIPDFIIDDRSYVSQFETETEMQSSMAASSFSEIDVSAAVSGSYLGFSGGASVDVSKSGSQSDSSSSSKTQKRVTIAYNFPRVTVFLDSRSLELTPACEKALGAIQTKEDLEGFQALYGEFFSRRVQLGGRLFATESVDTAAGATSSSTADRMKVAAAASFSGWGVNARLSASHGKGSESVTESSHASSSMNLAWQANGGDTLLCNKPPEWAPTVAYHWNWRITRQDQVGEILAVASKFKGMSWLETKAKDLGIETASVPIIATGPLGPKKAKSTGATISLNLASTPGGRYLMSCPADVINIATAATAVNKARGRHFTIGGNLLSRGLVFLGRSDSDGKELSRYYEVEDESGTKVSNISYNTKYRLRNTRRDSYVDIHLDQAWRWIFNNSTRSTAEFIMFENPNGSTDTAEIPDCGDVRIRFISYQDGTKRGYMHIVLEDTLAYLASTADTVSASEAAKLTLTYTE